MARPRLLASAVIVAAAACLLPDDWRLSTRLLIGWDLGTLSYLAQAVLMMGRSTYESMQRRAARQDASAAAVLALSTGAAIASLIAIAAELNGLHDVHGPDKTARLALAGVTILLSWLFAHLVFGMHYAHDYYAGEDDREGLAFPGDKRPDYWDFMYFAYTMGAASQTSDVAVTRSRMRRFVLAHTIVSFLFNTTVLALAINVGAGLI